MDYNTTQDELLNLLLQNHFNKRGKTPGVLLTVMYSGVALLAYGLLRRDLYTKRQITADTASPEMVETHAKVRGITKTEGETSDALLARYTDDIQNPKSGGNKRAWERWTEEVSYTHDEGTVDEWVEHARATAFENGRGPGTINIVVTSDRTEVDYEEIPTSQLLAAITAYLPSKRPLGISDFLVIGATRKVVDVDVSITAANFDQTSAKVAERLPALIKAVPAGSSLNQISISNELYTSGATDAVITTPAGNVTVQSGPTIYERVWAGTITVNQL